MLGVHVSKKSLVLDKKTSAKSLAHAIKRDTDALNLNSAQVFTYGPRVTKRNKFNPSRIKEVTKDLHLSVHSAYSTVSVWKILPNTPSSDKKKILTAVNDQIKSCAEINAVYWVLHITKQLPEQVAYVMKKYIKPIAKKHKVKVLLEMVSSKADELLTYETPEKINNLTTTIKPADWWGWCVDTAHLHGAGVAIRTNTQMSAWLKKLKYPKTIKMFHLNGSSVKLGSGKDKHEVPFGKYDVLWGNIVPEQSAVYSICQFAKKYNTVIICEIKRGSQKSVEHALEKITDMLV